MTFSEAKYPIAAAIAACLIAVPTDRLLPTGKIETTVQNIDEPHQQVIYNVPDSGGVIEPCAADKDVIKKLRSGSKVVIETSALFGRCQATIPSWPIDRDHFIQVAVRYTNPHYNTLEDLRKDYPGFTPRIELWGEVIWFLPESFRRYAVQMPEEMVILDPSGEVQTTRDCGSDEGDCTVVIPAKPERGIVGTFQYGPPDYAQATGLKFTWSNNPDAQISQSGHCFWAYSQAANTGDLTVGPSGAEPTRVRTGYGFYVVSIKGNVYSAQKTSREVFEKSRSCSEDMEATWPAISGGYGWKR